MIELLYEASDSITPFVLGFIVLKFHIFFFIILRIQNIKLYNSIKRSSILHQIFSIY